MTPDTLVCLWDYAAVYYPWLTQHPDYLARVGQALARMAWKQQVPMRRVSNEARGAAVMDEYPLWFLALHMPYLHPDSRTPGMTDPSPDRHTP